MGRLRFNIIDVRSMAAIVQPPLVAACLFLPASAAIGGPARTPLRFQTIELGTPLAAWRSLKPPGPISPHVRRVCSTDPGAAALEPRPPGLPRDAVVCGYVDAFGTRDLPVTFNWDQQFPMDHLRYVFRNGALTEVQAQISIDAFDDLVSDFKSSYGAPSQIVRDHMPTEIGPLPRVRFVWTPPAGRIEIVDPSTPGRLTLRLSATSSRAGAAPSG